MCACVCVHTCTCVRRRVLLVATGHKTFICSSINNSRLGGALSVPLTPGGAHKHIAASTCPLLQRKIDLVLKENMMIYYHQRLEYRGCDRECLG